MFTSTITSVIFFIALFALARSLRIVKQYQKGLKRVTTKKK